MSGRGRRLSEKVSDEAYLEGIGDKTIEELRELREECREAENEISFERRLSQARIDILTAEISRREGGSQVELVNRLPEILGGEERRQGNSPLPDRAPDFSIPRNADVPRRRVEEIVGEQTLARLSELDVDEVRGIIENLARHESNLSAIRRRIHTVMDELQAEIVRRYTSGEADPTSALR
jgi:hypothetical protein